MKKTTTLAIAILGATLFQSPVLAEGDHSHGHSEVAAQEQRAEATGTLNSIDIENRTVNISHGPISALDQPAMTMDFSVTDSVDLSALNTGDITFVLLVAEDGSYQVVEIVGTGGHSHSH